MANAGEAVLFPVHASPADRDESRCRLASRQNGRNLSHSLNPGKMRSAPAALSWPYHSLESENPPRRAPKLQILTSSQRGPVLGEARLTEWIPIPQLT